MLQYIIELALHTCLWRGVFQHPSSAITVQRGYRLCQRPIEAIIGYTWAVTLANGQRVMTIRKSPLAQTPCTSLASTGMGGDSTVCHVGRRSCSCWQKMSHVLRRGPSQARLRMRLCALVGPRNNCLMSPTATGGLRTARSFHLLAVEAFCFLLLLLHLLLVKIVSLTVSLSYFRLAFGFNMSVTDFTHLTDRNPTLIGQSGYSALHDFTVSLLSFFSHSVLFNIRSCYMLQAVLGELEVVTPSGPIMGTRLPSAAPCGT